MKNPYLLSKPERQRVNVRGKYLTFPSGADAATAQVQQSNQKRMNAKALPTSGQAAPDATVMRCLQSFQASGNKHKPRCQCRHQGFTLRPIRCPVAQTLGLRQGYTDVVII